MANLQPEWARFSVGTPSSRSNFTEPSCRELEIISHAAHVDAALSIVRDGQIKPGLIHDQSKLNKDRILVVWLSPNDWSGAGGSRYGNISFDFYWRSLVKDKKYYWVESIAYSTTACRILVTDKDHSREVDKLQEYDPTIGDGPWWYDTVNDKHYWNGTQCLEIMLERELPLEELLDTNFVKHHPKFCCNDPKTCSDLDQHAEQGGAHFLAGLASLQLDTRHLKLTKPNEGQTLPSDDTVLAWRRLKADLNRKSFEYRGRIDYDESVQSVAIARALLSAYWHRNEVEQQALSELFVSKQAMINSCVRLIREMLGVNYYDMADEQEDDFV